MVLMSIACMHEGKVVHKLMKMRGRRNVVFFHKCDLIMNREENLLHATND